MATMFRKLLSKKLPDGLLDVFERVYETWEQEEYKGYVGRAITQFKEMYPDYAPMILNFREGDTASKIQQIISEHFITIMDYPRHYEGCPLVSMEVIHHFLKSSESWLSLGQNNTLLLHCELGGWPVLAFMLAALLLYRKLVTSEHRALEMVRNRAPPNHKSDLQSGLDPSASQLRYLQYVLKRNADEQWPPADKALALDCVMMRSIPDFNGTGGCCPVFRIYGRDPSLQVDKTPKLLFSTPRRSKNVRSYNQAESELVKIDINCNIQGDIVLECINLNDDLVKETIMYRAMFNTAFIKSNTLMLSYEEVDIYWDKKVQFPKDFKAELLFSEMDAKASKVPVDLSCFEEEGLPMEAFGKVQEMFSSVDWLVPKSDAALTRLHQMALSDIVNEMLGTSFQKSQSSDLLQTLPMKNQGKEGATISHTKSKSSLLGDEKNTSAIVGPRSVSLPRQLPSSKQLQASLDGGTPHIILTCSHSVSEKLDTRVLEGGTSSLPPAQASNQPPSGPPTSDAPASDQPPAPPKEEGGGGALPPPPPAPAAPPPPPAPAAPPPPPVPKAPAPPAPAPPPPKSKPPPQTAPPAPPGPSANGNKDGGAAAPPPPPGSKGGGAAPPPPAKKAPMLSRTTAVKPQPGKKLKPLHWSKMNKVGKGTLWAEAEKSGEDARPPEIDMSELETLFSASNPNSDKATKLAKSKAANKPEKVSLIEHRRAYNCEIMLSKVKTPLNELMNHVLNLDDSAMDVDQVDNLIKFCPTKEEMELIKGYTGDTEKLGKCELFYMELMKVPRAEAKLVVFSYKLQFSTQVSELRDNLNNVYLSSEQIRSSVKLRRIMQTILSLGNALNQGTARGAAVGFKLDSLLKLKETRARSNKMTLMHYLCKVLADKLPELLDFSKELGSLEPASKIQLKILAEEMQAITKGLEKVVQEKKLSKKDGQGISKKFRKSLKKFLASAEPDVKNLAALYSGVGQSVDALIIYFGEDPKKLPYETVINTLHTFVRMFNQAHEDNCKQIEAEKKAAQKAAEQEKAKAAEQERLKAAEQDKLRAEEKEKLKAQNHTKKESELIRNKTPIESAE